MKSDSSGPSILNVVNFPLTHSIRKNIYYLLTIYYVAGIMRSSLSTIYHLNSTIKYHKCHYHLHFADVETGSENLGR